MNQPSVPEPLLQAYNPPRSLPAKLRRRLVQWRAVAPLPVSPRRPLVSISFDDFPRTAALAGAEVLERFGARGTYYACSGMVGLSNATGPLYNPADLHRLAQAGHEIAAHTHGHMDCAQTDLAGVLADIDRSDRALAELGLTQRVCHFAYPFSETTLALKRHLGERYSSARGGLPGLNRRGSDRLQLRAYSLTPEARTTERAAAAIAQAVRQNAWAILYTHDVQPEPSPYGTTPTALAQLLQLASDAGATVLPVGQALAEIVATTDDA